MYCAGTAPGCGRQSRAVGAHGKIESNGAVASSIGPESEAIRVRLPLHGQVVDVDRVHDRTLGVAAAVVLGADDGRRRVIARTPVAVDVRRQEPIADVLEVDVGVLRVEEELDGPGLRLAVHQLVLLERVDADPVAVDRAEIARRHQVRVRPDAVLRIVREVVAAVHVLLRDERVAVVRARRVAARRDRDAVVERQSRIVEPARRELAEEPAVGGLVVEDDRITRGIGAVLDREAGPERAGVDRAEQLVPGLVPDAEHEIDHLDVVVRANVPDGIGRIDPEAEDVEVVRVAQPLEVDERAQGRHRRVTRGLESCVARVPRIDVGYGGVQAPRIAGRCVVDPSRRPEDRGRRRDVECRRGDDPRRRCGGSAGRCRKRSGESDAEDDEQARSPCVSLIHVPSF